MARAHLAQHDLVGVGAEQVGEGEHGTVIVRRELQAARHEGAPHLDPQLWLTANAQRLAFLGRHLRHARASTTKHHRRRRCCDWSRCKAKRDAARSEISSGTPNKVTQLGS